MLPGIPLTTRPAQADLDRAFAGADGASLRRSGEDLGELFAQDVATLHAAARIDEGALGADPLDPPDSLEVQLTAGGLDTNVVVIRPDLSVRSMGWGQAAAAADPRALRAWLAARAGAARLLGEDIRSPEWDGRGQLEGTEIVGVARAGRLRRARAAPGGVVAIDGYQIVRLRPGGARDELVRILRPDTPLAVRGHDVWFVHTSGPRSVPLEGGEVRDRHGAWFGLPARRIARDVPRYHREREAALARVLPEAATRIALRIDRDEREAYEAFGGELPSALSASHFWACDTREPRLLRVSKGGESQALPLPGLPAAIGAQGERVHVVVTREGAVSVVVVGRDLRPRMRRWIPARPEDVRGVILVGDDVWLRLAARDGDVLVAQSGPDLDL